MLRKISILMTLIFCSKLWAYSCPVPGVGVKAEWFQIDASKKEAHARVRFDSKIWTMNIFSKKYLLDSTIIQRTLQANTTNQTAYNTLGCLRCAYRSNYQYPVEFWACGN